MASDPKTRRRRAAGKPATCEAAAGASPLALAAALALALGWPIPAIGADTDLTTLSLEQLLDVRVVGASKYEQKQADVAAAVSIITRDEIRAFGWRTVDEALSTLPGLYTTYDRQYTYLGTRGFGVPGDFSTRILVTIDGNRLNDPVYDQGPFGRTLPLDIDLVERIEFIPGPGGAVHGQNAMFGVVNLVTRRGVDVDGAELAVSLQSPQRLADGRFSWGRRLDNGLDLLVSATGVRARGEDRFQAFGASGIAGVAKGLDFQRDREFFASARIAAWSLEVLQGQCRKGDPTAAYFADPLVPGNELNDRYRMAQLRYQAPDRGEPVQVSARVSFGNYRFRGQAIYGTPVSSRVDTAWRGAELQGVSSAIADHKLMLGVEWQDITRRDQQFIDFAAPSNNVLVRDSGFRVGVYAQDEWRLGAQWSATLGLRLDRHDGSGETQFNPRLALIWHAAPLTTVKALYGRAHRAPNANERDYGDGVTQVSNPSLEGERIDTTELVLDHRLAPDLGLRVSLYQWLLDDPVALGMDPVSGLSQYQSGGMVRARGMEWSMDKTWRSGARLQGNLSLQRVTSSDAQPLPNSPRVLAKLAWSGPLAWSGLRAGVEWQGETPRTTISGQRLGAHGIAHLHLRSGRLPGGLELSASLRNVFDRRYAQPGADTNWQDALEQDGRSLRIQLRSSF